MPTPRNTMYTACSYRCSLSSEHALNRAIQCANLSPCNTQSMGAPNTCSTSMRIKLQPESHLRYCTLRSAGASSSCARNVAMSDTQMIAEHMTQVHFCNCLHNCLLPSKCCAAQRLHQENVSYAMSQHVCLLTHLQRIVAA